MHVNLGKLERIQGCAAGAATLLNFLQWKEGGMNFVKLVLCSYDRLCSTRSYKHDFVLSGGVKSNRKLLEHPCFSLQETSKTIVNRFLWDFLPLRWLTTLLEGRQTFVYIKRPWILTNFLEFYTK